MEYSEQVVAVISECVVRTVKQFLAQYNIQVDDKLRNIVITGDNIQPLSITGEAIGTGAIQGGHIGQGVITGNNIAQGTITGHNISAGTITGTNIGNGTITGDNIGIGTVTGQNIGAGAITGDNIATGTINGVHFQDGSITANKIDTTTLNADYVNAVIANIMEANIDWAKIKSLEAFSAVITNAEIGNLLAGDITVTGSLAAKLAEFINARIDNAEIGAAQIENLSATIVNAVVAHINELDAEAIQTDELWAAIATIAVAKISTAEITTAQIQNAHINWANIDGLTAGTALIEQSVTGKLVVNDLAVTEANMVSLTVGELMLKAADGSFVRLVVDEEGKVSTEQVTVANDNIANSTIQGTKLVENTITARQLNVTDIFAQNTTTMNLIAKHIDVDELYANEAFISKLNTTFIQGDGSLTLTLAEAVNRQVDEAVSDVIEPTIQLLEGKITAIVGETKEVWEQDDWEPGQSLVKISDSITDLEESQNGFRFRVQNVESRLLGNTMNWLSNSTGNIGRNNEVAAYWENTNADTVMVTDEGHDGHKALVWQKNQAASIANATATKYITHLTKGDVLTFSCYYQAKGLTSEENGIRIVLYKADAEIMHEVILPVSQNTSGDEWVYGYATYQLEDDLDSTVMYYVELFLGDAGTLYISQLMVQSGPDPIEWSPSIDDNQIQAEQVSSKIAELEITNDSIVSKVEEKLRDLDIETVVGSYVNEHPGEITSLVSQQIFGQGSTNPIEQLQTALIQTPQAFGILLESQKADLDGLVEQINAHFSFELDGLHIFKLNESGEKKFQLVLQEDRISFYDQNHTEIAHFANDQLHVDHIISDTSLKIGNLKTTVVDGVVDWIDDG